MSRWSFVLIPDTQHLPTPTEGLEHYFTGLRDWIVSNVDTYDIRFIGGLGDIIHSFSNDASWSAAETALLPLFDLDKPVLMLACGNHDPEGPLFPAIRDTTKYNVHFGPSRYSGKPWFGGVYESGKAENMWTEYTVGEHDYLTFILEFYPRDGALDWMESVTEAHPNHRVIIITHAFLYFTGIRDEWGAGYGYGPTHYFTEGTDDANSGQEMWEGWLKTIPNLFGVFNGHHIANSPGTDNLAYRIDPNSAGKPVLQGFYNWQEEPDGGKGRIMLMTVDETAGTIRQQVVRPDLDAFETGTSRTFNYDQTHQIWAPPVPPLAPGTYTPTVGGIPQAVNIGGVPHVIAVA